MAIHVEVVTMLSDVPSLALTDMGAEALADSVEQLRAPLGSGGCRREVRRISELIAPATALPVPLGAAITKARATGAGLDAEIELEVRGISGQVEHELGRALIEQTWRVTLDGFPDAIKLCKPPVIAIDHVKFYDVDGAQQTLDPQDYVIDRVEVVPQLRTVTGRRWPDTEDRPGAVEVQFRCGYGPDFNSVPAPIQSYILARVEAEHFPEKATNAKFLDSLLDGFKVYG